MKNTMAAAPLRTTNTPRWFHQPDNHVDMPEESPETRYNYMREIIANAEAKRSKILQKSDLSHHDFAVTEVGRFTRIPHQQELIVETTHHEDSGSAGKNISKHERTVRWRETVEVCEYVPSDGEDCASEDAHEGEIWCDMLD